MTSILDLPRYVGQRSATFRFGLTNGVTGEVLDDLHPIADPPAVVSHDTSRTIKRQLTLTLGVEDAARIDTITARVTPYMIVGGVEYPLGVFLFANSMSVEYLQGNLMPATLLDTMFIVDQQIETAVAPFNAGGSTQIVTLIQSILNPLKVKYQVESSNYTTNGTWPIGTNRGSVLEDLALQGGYFSPWFDDQNIMRFELAFDPANALVDFDWDANQVAIRGTMTRSNDMLTAPNRFIVVSNSTSDSSMAAVPIVGRYDVPDSAPWSIASRGFVVPSVITLGTDTTDQAQTIATTIGQRQMIVETYEVDTPPDPRHDSYDVIEWRDDKWLELAWSLTCKEGEPMHHVLRRAFR